MDTLDRGSKEARELARRPIGKTWVNVDGLEQATKQMGAVTWVRRNGWGGEARGVFGILEHKIWTSYKDGTDEAAWLIIAITVDDVQDVGRDAWIEIGGRRRPIDRYELSGTVYQLRDDDLILGSPRDMPGGGVPFELVTSRPNLVYVSGLSARTRRTGPIGNN